MPLGIFECERKSLLPNSWKYESFCDGEELRSVLALKWWLATDRVWAGVVDEGGGGAGLEVQGCQEEQSHLLLARPHTFLVHMHDRLQANCSVQIEKERFFLQVVCGAVKLFPFWSNVKDRMHILALLGVSWFS